MMDGHFYAEYCGAVVKADPAIIGRGYPVSLRNGNEGVWRIERQALGIKQPRGLYVDTSGIYVATVDEILRLRHANGKLVWKIQHTFPIDENTRASFDNGLMTLQRGTGVMSVEFASGRIEASVLMNLETII